MYLCNINQTVFSYTTRLSRSNIWQVRSWTYRSQVNSLLHLYWSVTAFSLLQKYMYKLCNEHTPFWGRWMLFWSTLLYPGGAQYATEPSPVFVVWIKREAQGLHPTDTRSESLQSYFAARSFVWPCIIVQSDLTEPVGEHFCFYAVQTNHAQAVGSFGCQHAGCPSVSPLKHTVRANVSPQMTVWTPVCLFMMHFKVSSTDAAECCGN